MAYKLKFNYICIICLSFLISSCSDIGGIVEIAVKDGINKLLDKYEKINEIKEAKRRSKASKTDRSGKSRKSRKVKASR